MCFFVRFINKLFRKLWKLLTKSKKKIMWNTLLSSNQNTSHPVTKLNSVLKWLFQVMQIIYERWNINKVLQPYRIKLKTVIMKHGINHIIHIWLQNVTFVLLIILIFPALDNWKLWGQSALQSNIQAHNSRQWQRVRDFDSLWFRTHSNPCKAHS